jgi:hypothetical protein
MNYKHGKTYSPTWHSWMMMKRRCAGYTPTHKKHYTDNGIKVCERWQSFENFLADMGDRPQGTTLDRIDLKGNYEPGNCRWADSVTQGRNRSNTVRITHNGQTKTVCEWAESLGLPAKTISSRLGKGWPTEKILTPHMLHELKGRRIHA